MFAFEAALLPASVDPADPFHHLNPGQNPLGNSPPQGRRQQHKANAICDESRREQQSARYRKQQSLHHLPRRKLASFQTPHAARQGRQPLYPQKGDTNHRGDHHAGDGRPDADVATHFYKQVHFHDRCDEEEQKPHGEKAVGASCRNL